ncbi:ATP-binding protein [Leeuwenhoekiella parthenopeia]|uniref:ATP-binding protein n=1 Tax=Leeuwenhoekiella parthenopeia TaxID=2890320 RepID=A0ABS8GU85_9FLAO|nr:ATP-binding protein [Leeuwenhoekiella parthenopeia]MCC4213572.1 ATP-binding protein [Leeuwenhoekiella parthenopeia]
MANIKTQIGKDVIESLTLGMYEDSRFIFREYIQNSADQIDKAVEDGLFDTLRDGKIEIEIQPNTEKISITDNATGISKNNVQSILKNIAKSTKDRTKNKGFRGIGRLGGLAYADRLIFETSFKGEDVKTYLIWNAQELKSIINNRSTKEDASKVIDQVTTFKEEKEDKETHYFKVTLEGVKNKTLLDKDDIYDYLTMVAPVPYKKGFFFKDKVYTKAKELDFNIDEYLIYVNRNQVLKSYTMSIYSGDTQNRKKIDEIHDIETYEIRNSSNQLLAWGWYAISNFTKVLPAINTARCLRLRKGNIQIGLEDALSKLFKESRGTKYFFGEVYAVSPELIPNSRRDYFTENKALKEFEKHLKFKFFELHNLYHFSSKVRNSQKKIDDLVDFTKVFEQKSKNGGFTDEKEKADFIEKFEQKKEKAATAEAELKKEKEKISSADTSKSKVFDNVVKAKNKDVSKVKIKDTGKTKFITDDITTLSRKDRKLVSKIFGVVDTVLTPDLASLLKEKIKEELQ